ncbi:uncharacterized protein LOC113204784 isoform X1 [Frankliniella occidentalis]|uniref:Uncharacterized protein LOC113204784 isoform X1 n=1 Tax=Frankliniella occidentalis TaxID=133901 RepID=A0A6J1S4I8_FRAOC|nr:uncharacterized protein LOC113204784 isoform X1 [Frankliniella occidentalis]
MTLKCDSCLLKFDLHSHRPKNLPCGHTICKECVENPTLGRKCPTCKKAFKQRRPHNLPDTAIVVRLLEDEDEPPSKKPKTENPELQQLQRGADAGRKVVEMLRLVVPQAVKALNRQLGLSITNLARVEAALERGMEPGAAGAVDTTADASDPLRLDEEEPLQLAEQLEASHRLLTSTKCTVAAEGEGGSAWTASVQPGGCGDILRLLLLLVSNANLAQQLASGKFQLATVNSEQVPDTQGEPKSVAESSQKEVGTTEQPTQQPAQQPPAIVLLPSPVKTGEEKECEIERSLKAGQPPGTVTKCITAQVMHTGQGPRIMLQGVQATEFTQDQLELVQTQVKQNLLQAQAKGNKASILGPTKFLVVMRPKSATPATPTQPPPKRSEATKVAVEPKPSQKLRADGQLGKVDDASAVPATPVAAYVGPPLISVLTITNQHLDNNGRLKVNDILRDVPQQWSTPRSLRDLKGEGSEDLLRVMGAHLEELQTSGEVQPSVMEEVLKMSALRRLEVKCTLSEKYPDLPLQLEELHINQATENQLRCLEHMPRLRSLTVLNYVGSNLTFPPSQHNRLLWLCVGFNAGHKFTMMSLIRAHASSVQELRVWCTPTDSNGKSFYFPDLGQELAACGLSALRRLVLDRRLEKSRCSHQAASCLLQRRTVRDALFPLPVEVFCTLCHRAEF